MFIKPNLSHLSVHLRCPFHKFFSHIYALGNAAYQAMLRTEQKQAIVISGESGAGKTECSRLLIEFLTTDTQGDRSQVVRQVRCSVSQVQSNLYMTSLRVVVTLYIKITGLFPKKLAFNFCKVHSVPVYDLHMYMLWFKFFLWFEFLCFLPVHNDQQIGSLSNNCYLIITNFIQKLITLSPVFNIVWFSLEYSCLSSFLAAKCRYMSLLQNVPSSEELGETDVFIGHVWLRMFP